LGVGKFRGFVKAGGVFKAKTEQGYSKQCFLAKVFGRKPLSHENAMSLIYRFKSIVQKTRYLV
ncbi:hypothetical protein ACR9K3_07535, partial [Helicobacter pylori]